MSTSVSDDDPRARAAEYLANRDAGNDAVVPRPAAHAPFTAEQRAGIVETAIAQAIRAGAFDDLPGAGKPIEGLGATHDPDWWIRRKIQHEQLTGLGPVALTLRVEDAALDETLDGLRTEAQVVEALEDFNRRVIEARRQLLGGPPVITAVRDIEATLAAWHERRAAASGPTVAEPTEPRRRRLRPRLSRRRGRQTPEQDTPPV